MKEDKSHPVPCPLRRFLSRGVSIRLFSLFKASHLSFCSWRSLSLFLVISRTLRFAHFLDCSRKVILCNFHTFLSHLQLTIVPEEQRQGVHCHSHHCEAVISLSLSCHGVQTVVSSRIVHSTSSSSRPQGRSLSICENDVWKEKKAVFPLSSLSIQTETQWPVPCEKCSR